MKIHWMPVLLLSAGSGGCSPFSMARQFEKMVPASDLIAVATVTRWQWKTDSDTETATLKIHEVWKSRGAAPGTIRYKQIHVDNLGGSESIPRQGINDAGTYLFFLKKGDGGTYQGAGAASSSFLISKSPSGGVSGSHIRYQYPLTFIQFKNGDELIKVVDVSKAHPVVLREKPECEKLDESDEKKECRIYLDDFKKYIQSGMYDKDRIH